MEINDFIKNFAEQFDDTDISEFSAQTNFRNLDEWTSLLALVIMTTMEKSYGVKLKPDEFKKINTIQELFDVVKSKKESDV